MKLIEGVSFGYLNFQKRKWLKLKSFDLEGEFCAFIIKYYTYILIKWFRSISATADSNEFEF